LTIEAMLIGNHAPVLPRVEVADGETWRAAAMTGDGAGRFRLVLNSVTVPFQYRVAAGPVTSPTYAITVAHPPRVARIDLEYVYPAALGIKPRTEIDSGDVYAPAGTDVHVHVLTDRPAVAGLMSLSDGSSVSLSSEGPDVFSTKLRVVEDSSYRLTLTDREGLSSPGDVEYFIRTLADRPPEVHIVKPASDRAVTPL